MKLRIYLLQFFTIVLLVGMSASCYAVEWHAQISLTTDSAKQIAAQDFQSAALPLQKAGVMPQLVGDVLEMTGNASSDQLSSILFDDLSPLADFLGGPVKLELVFEGVHNDFTLALEARNTTGYIWEVTDSSGAVIKNNGKTSSLISRYRAYGAPAIQNFTFHPPQDGKLEIQLIYHRPFEMKAAPVNVLSVQGDVGADSFQLIDPTPKLPDGEGFTPDKESSPDAYSELDTTKALPSAWDWRNQTPNIVPPVRDQGSCGSCWSFGTVGVMESAVRKAGGPLTDLSEQFLVNCNLDGWDCGGGLTANKYHYNTLGRNQTVPGAVFESVVPYVAYEQSCLTAYQHPYKLSGWQFITGSEWTMPTVTQIKNAILTYGPITAGVCVDNGWYSYGGGVYTPTNNVCGGSTNHQIVLVGWDDNTQTWILRNSWGPYWGESGYMRIQWDTTGATSRVGEGTSWVRHETIAPVASSAADLSGVFSLLVEEATPWVPPADPCVETISIGMSKSGTWLPGCLSTHRSGSYARFYTLSIPSTTTVTINLISTVDTFMYLLDGENKNGSIITSDDDSGDGFNSRIILSLTSGKYTIEATTFGSATTGNFTLTVQ